MPLTKEQIQWEKDWVQRWFNGSRTRKVENWADPFYAKDAKVLRVGLPDLVGIDAIRECVIEMGQFFSAFEASNVDVTVDEDKSRVIVRADMTISLAADPNQQRFTIPAALFLKKKLGVNEEKMDEELAFLDRGVLSQKLTELGIPPPSAIA